MSKKLNLTKDPIWYLLGKVTIPASVGSLFQTFYNLVDTWFAGKISAEAIGAIAKSFPIYFVIIAVGVGIGAATNASIGNLLGAKKTNQASLLVAQSDLLEMVEKTESRVQSQALELTDQLEKEIGLSRLNAIIISFSAVVLSMLLVHHVVRHHIRKPLNALKHGFDRLESGSLKNPINLTNAQKTTISIKRVNFPLFSFFY